MNTDEQGKVTSGAHNTSWQLNDGLPNLSTLSEDLQTDVVIVGAGIAGLCTAYGLVKRGKKVVVIDDGLPGSGETGRTSAHLTAMLDRNYTEYTENIGAENTKLLAQSHMEAIRSIEQISREENIYCDFKRVSGYLFIHPSDTETDLNKEQKAASDAGLKVRIRSAAPGMLKQVEALEFEDQAQFHPLKFIYGLCDAILRYGGQIFISTHASEISSEGVKTESGHSIQADHVVVATNFPVNNRFIMSFKQTPHRTYMIGALIPKGSLAPALWSDTGDFNRNKEMPPYHYVRIQPLNEENDLLLCGGEDHVTGDVSSAEPEMPESDRYELLENWAREHFDIGDVVHRWSGQVQQSIDGIGFIGHNPFDKKNVYIVTGDSGDGLTNGAIAGMLLPDLIDETENPWKDLYRPARKGLRAAISGSIELAGYMLTKRDDIEDEDAIGTIKPGEGKLIEIDNKKCGVYRHDDGTLTLLSATCTHVGCSVAWNNDEKTWDCPCHGSRFSATGEVLNGPANEDLPAIKQSDVLKHR